MRIRIANRTWSLDFVKASEMQSRANWGECDLPTARKPMMTVRRSLADHSTDRVKWLRIR